MSKLLEKWGYTVKNKSGKENFLFNIVDCILFCTSFIISLINAYSSNPSILIYIMNILILVKFLINNINNQHLICNKFNSIPQDTYNYISINITKIHITKIITEIIFLIFFIVCFMIYLYDNTIIFFMNILVSFILVITLLENTLHMVENLYNAQPLPLLINTSKCEEGE